MLYVATTGLIHLQFISTSMKEDIKTNESSPEVTWEIDYNDKDEK